MAPRMMPGASRSAQLPRRAAVCSQVHSTLAGRAPHAADRAACLIIGQLRPDPGHFDPAAVEPAGHHRIVRGRGGGEQQVPVRAADHATEGVLAGAYALEDPAALAHPHAYQLVFGQPLRLSEAQLAAVDELGRRCFDPFRQAVVALYEQGQVRAPDAEVAAQVAWATAHGMVSLLVAKSAFPWAAEPAALCAVARDSLFGGLFVEPSQAAAA